MAATAYVRVETDAGAVNRRLRAYVGPFRGRRRERIAFVRCQACNRGLVFCSAAVACGDGLCCRDCTHA